MSDWLSLLGWSIKQCSHPCCRCAIVVYTVSTTLNDLVINHSKYERPLSIWGWCWTFNFSFKFIVNFDFNCSFNMRPMGQLFRKITSNISYLFQPLLLLPRNNHHGNTSHLLHPPPCDYHHGKHKSSCSILFLPTTWWSLHTFRNR